MTDIQQRMIVKTSDGITGRVIRTVAVNGVTFHRLQRVIVCASGRVIETAQRAFVADSEVIAFRAAPAQPAAWQGARSTAQLIPTVSEAMADARAAFEAAIAPVEAEYAPTVESLNDAFNAAFDNAARSGAFHRRLHRETNMELYVTDDKVYKVITSKDGQLHSFVYERAYYTQGQKIVDFAAKHMSEALDAGIEAARAEFRAAVEARRMAAQPVVMAAQEVAALVA